MAKGLALAIGLNAVDPKHYQGWSGELNACEADAQDMAEIAKSKGFQVRFPWRFSLSSRKGGENLYGGLE